MRSLALVFLALALSAAPGAFAKSEKPKAGAEEQLARAIVVEAVPMPVFRKNRLVNYIYISVRVELVASADAFKLRERSHFLRDSVLRAVHRADLSDPARTDQLNTAAALPLIRAAAVQALGDKAVAKVEITNVVAQTPQT